MSRPTSREDINELLLGHGVTPDSALLDTLEQLLLDARGFGLSEVRDRIEFHLVRLEGALETTGNSAIPPVISVLNQILNDVQAI